MYADSSFDKVFDVKCIVGKLDDLKNPNQIFLTKELAVKYFGSVNDALNNEVVIQDSLRLNIAGIVENPPKIRIFLIKQ